MMVSVLCVPLLDFGFFMIFEFFLSLFLGPEDPRDTLDQPDALRLSIAKGSTSPLGSSFPPLPPHLANGRALWPDRYNEISRI